MKIRWKQLLACIAIPIAVGGVSAWLSRGGMQEFASLNQPPLSPPGWLFPVVWTILFILMGVASYMVLQSGRPKQAIHKALGLYGIQLAVNFFWSIIFFGLSQYLFAFIWLVFLLVLILLTAVGFYRLSPPAGYLMIPYILWVVFAGYLNFSIYLLN